MPLGAKSDAIAFYVQFEELKEKQEPGQQSFSKAKGDDKVSLMNLAIVLNNWMDTVTLKLMKGSVRKNNNKKMQKSILGMGKEVDKV